MKIIVLNFETAETHVFDYSSIYKDDNEFFESSEAIDNGLNQNNCQWMIVDKLKLQIH